MVVPDTFNHDIGGNEVSFAGDDGVKGRNLVAAKTHIFSPSTIGDFRYRNIHCWFDPAAFTTPPAFTWGTLGRNSMNAPALYNLDLSVAKCLELGGSARAPTAHRVFQLAEPSGVWLSQRDGRCGRRRYHRHIAASEPANTVRAAVAV